MSPFAGICLLTCAFVRGRGLVRPEEKETVERQRVEQEAKKNKDKQGHIEGQNGSANGQSDEKIWECHGMDRDLEKGAASSTTREAEGSEVDKHSEIEVEKVKEIGVMDIANHLSTSGLVDKDFE